MIFRCGLEEGAEIKVYLSNAPEDCALRTLVRISGLRWPVETALEEGTADRTCWLGTDGPTT